MVESELAAPATTATAAPMAISALVLRPAMVPAAAAPAPAAPAAGAAAAGTGAPQQVPSFEPWLVRKRSTGLPKRSEFSSWDILLG